MTQAVNSLDATAQRVARFPADPTPGAPRDSVDLSAEMVNLMQARNDFATNAKVFKSLDEMTKTLLNVLG